MRDHVYEYDEVVVGGSVSAHAYAFLNSKPVVFTTVKKPYFFDAADHTFPWENLVFALNLSGLIPCADNITKLRIDEDNILKAVTQNSRLIKFKFDELRIFDDENVEGLPVPTKEEQQYRVLDWINVKSGMTHEYDILETEDDFVNKVYFYPSLRDSMPLNKKDAVALSFLCKDQINQFEYSDTYVRFKVLDMMKKAGIRGARNGRDTLNPDKYKYYAVKAETSHRDVQKVKMDLYQNTGTLKFDYKDYKANVTEHNSQLMKINNMLSIGN